MVRVKQFADDLGISKNKAQGLINKGRSRKDGGSQILENVMKPKGYKDGGSKTETKTKTNPKAPIAKVTREKLKKIVTIKVDKPSKKPSKKLTQKQKIAEAIEAGTLQVGDVNEMTEHDMKQFLKGNSKGTFKDLSGDNKITMKDVLIGRGVIDKPVKKAKGGGIAIQGLGFTGVK